MYKFNVNLFRYKMYTHLIIYTNIHLHINIVDNTHFTNVLVNSGGIIILVVSMKYKKYVSVHNHEFDTKLSSM